MFASYAEQSVSRSLKNVSSWRERFVILGAFAVPIRKHASLQ